MKVKITFDPDGAYGYPQNNIIEAKQLVADYIESSNEVEDADTISFLKSLEIEKAVDFVAEAWCLDYELIPDDMVIRVCAICGRHIVEGYVFDGTDCFCSKECATDFFDNDEGCIDILVDEGERLIWMDSLPTAPHYKVGIGADNPNNFHYCDSWQKVLDWINTKVFPTIKTQQDIDDYNEKHQSAKIDIILFDANDYYKTRREYVQCLRDCDDFMTKAQRLPNGLKRDYLIRLFGKRYEDANWYWDMYPEVWQGEI